MNTIDWLRHGAIFFATVGQFGFVGLWLTRRWWMHWVTRAVMAKSVTLMLLLIVSSMRLVVEYVSDQPPWSQPVEPHDAWDVTFMVLYWLVAVSIWGQFVALVLQVRRDALTADEIVQAEIDAARFAKS